MLTSRWWKPRLKDLQDAEPSIETKNVEKAFIFSASKQASLSLHLFFSSGLISLPLHDSSSSWLDEDRGVHFCMTGAIKLKATVRTNSAGGGGHAAQHPMDKFRSREDLEVFLRDSEDLARSKAFTIVMSWNLYHVWHTFLRTLKSFCWTSKELCDACEQREREKSCQPCMQGRNSCLHH